jgi:hypothetical protein
MKHIILFTFLIFISACSIAQTTSKTKSTKTGNEWHAAGDAIPRSKEFADRLSVALRLDAATSKKVREAYLANTKSVDETKLGPGSDAEKTSALKSNKDAFDEVMKNMLTQAQLSLYLKMPVDRTWKL